MLQAVDLNIRFLVTNVGRLNTHANTDWAGNIIIHLDCRFRLLKPGSLDVELCHVNFNEMVFKGFIFIIKTKQKSSQKITIRSLIYTNIHYLL